MGVLLGGSVWGFCLGVLFGAAVWRCRPIFARLTAGCFGGAVWGAVRGGGVLLEVLVCNHRPAFRILGFAGL